MPSMRALSNADFLTLWENGHRLHPLDRALLAIRASLPETPDSRVTDEPVADWTLGRRNRALAELRTLYFGPRLEGGLPVANAARNWSSKPIAANWQKPTTKLPANPSRSMEAPFACPQAGTWRASPRKPIRNKPHCCSFRTAPSTPQHPSHPVGLKAKSKR